MAEQLWGAGTGLVLVLAYVLLVQAMTAAIVLLGEFIVMQWRALRSLVAVAPPPEPVPEERAEPYRVGGGIKKWD